MWNLSENCVEKYTDKIKNIKWSRLNFPHDLYCKYQFYQNLIMAEDEPLKENMLNKKKKY